MHLRWGRLIPLCLGIAVGVGNGSCGADNLDAPQAPPLKQQCQSLSQMAPALTSLLLDPSSNQSAQLRYVIQNYLLASPGPNQEPPIVSLLRIGFGTINAFANDPPEPGGNPCNDASPPEPQFANRICELRRMLNTFVHQGEGLDALHLIDPVIYDVFGYIEGQAPLATTPHYEVADFLSRSCASPGLCKMTSTLDLLAAVLAYLRPPQGAIALNAIVTLWNDPNLTGPNGFLTNLNVQGNIGEDGFVALFQFLLSAILEMKPDSTYFDNFQNVLNQFVYPNINDTQYPGLRTELDNVVAIVKDMLDPTREEPILQPLQDFAYCVSQIDQNYFNKNGDLIRMVYRLAFDAQVLGMKDLLNAFQGLLALDQRGTVIETLHSLVVAVRGDDQGVTALGQVCAVSLCATSSPVCQGNAQRVVPVAADLFDQGAVAEILCVADTFLYGCSGGSQPACTKAQ